MEGRSLQSSNIDTELPLDTTYLGFDVRCASRAQFIGARDEGYSDGCCRKFAHGLFELICVFLRQQRQCVGT